MIAAGEATDWGQAASTADASTAAQVPAAAAASSRRGSGLDADVEAAENSAAPKLARPSEEADSEKPMQKRARRTDESGEAAMLVALVGISEPPKIELWKDRRAWYGSRFPKYLQEQGRLKEVTQLYNFEAVADTTLEPGETCYDMIWVEEWRGEEVRCRLVVRQYNLEIRLDVFSAKPRLRTRKQF